MTPFSSGLRKFLERNIMVFKRVVDLMTALACTLDEDSPVKIGGVCLIADSLKRRLRSASHKGRGLQARDGCARGYSSMAWRKSTSWIASSSLFTRSKALFRKFPHRLTLNNTSKTSSTAKHGVISSELPHGCMPPGSKLRAARASCKLSSRFAPLDVQTQPVHGVHKTVNYHRGWSTTLSLLPGTGTPEVALDEPSNVASL